MSYADIGYAARCEAWLCPAGYLLEPFGLCPWLPISCNRFNGFPFGP